MLLCHKLNLHVGATFYNWVVVETVQDLFAFLIP